MANVDIVYEWTAGDLLLGIDASGRPYCWVTQEGEGRAGAWLRATVPSAMLPALAALARIAETLNSVTWRADNRMDGRVAGNRCSVCGATATFLVAPTIAEARYFCMACAISKLDEAEPQEPAPEAGREESEQPFVGEPAAGEASVEPPPPLLEPPEE